MENPFGLDTSMGFVHCIRILGASIALLRCKNMPYYSGIRNGESIVGELLSELPSPFKYCLFFDNFLPHCHSSN